MRVLIIPDVHLKLEMFDSAKMIMEAGKADIAVCLGDLADDWGRQWDKELYAETYDRAIQFEKEFPTTLWCYGNHDISYVWQAQESGYSPVAGYTVCTKLHELREACPDPGQLAFIHRIDDVLFVHGGLTEGYVKKYVAAVPYSDADAVIATINGFEDKDGYYYLWNDLSPIWFRPQYYPDIKMYMQKDLIQVVGHTPITRPRHEGCVISCDVFSTDRNRIPMGTQEFVIIDTETRNYTVLRSGMQH